MFDWESAAENGEVAAQAGVNIHLDDPISRYNKQLKQKELVFIGKVNSIDENNQPITDNFEFRYRAENPVISLIAISGYSTLVAECLIRKLGFKVGFKVIKLYKDQYRDFREQTGKTIPTLKDADDFTDSICAKFKAGQHGIVFDNNFRRGLSLCLIPGSEVVDYIRDIFN